MQEHVQVVSSKCKACRRCEVACIASHHGLDFKTAMKQKALYSPRCWAVKGDDYKTSVRCHCCNPAPCCNICPTGALHQNEDGSFSIHLELCAGCMMCMSVCPYGCISPEEIGKSEGGESLPAAAAPHRTIAVRCDLCHDWRLEKGVEYTACMEACMTQALVLVRTDGTILEMPKPEKKAAPKAAVAEGEPAAHAKPKEEKKNSEPAVEAEPAQSAAAVETTEAAPKAESKAEPVSEAEKPAEDAGEGDVGAQPASEEGSGDKGSGKGEKKVKKVKKKNK